MNLRLPDTVWASIRSGPRRTAALAVAAAVTAAYQFLPAGWRAGAYAFVALTAWAVLMLAARRGSERDVRRFAAGIGCLIAGDLVWGFTGHATVLQSACYYTGSGLMLAALAGLARRRGDAARWDLALDVTLSILVGVIAVTQLVLLPYGNSHLSLAHRLVVASYPLLDLVLISVAVSLLLRPGELRGFIGPVTTGLGVLLVGDLSFALASQTAPYDNGGVVDVAWLAFYVLAAVGGLAARVTPAHAQGTHSSTYRRTVGLVVLTLAVVATPLVDFVAARQAGRPGSWTAAGALIVGTVVIVRVRRLWGEADVAVEALRSSEARFRSLVQNSATIVTIHEIDGAVRYASPNLATILGYTSADELPENPFDLIHPDDVDAMVAAFAACQQRPGRDEPKEFRYRDASGQWRWLEGVRDNRLDDPDVAGIVFTCQEVSARKEAQSRLVHQAHHDAVTGLPNQTLLRVSLAEALDRRRLTGHPLAVLFVDLDRFKNINDNLGHGAGDEILIEAGERLRRAVRADDIVARFGGDEFVVVIENLEEAATHAFVDRLLEALAAPYRLAGGTVVYTSATVGVRYADAPDTTLEELLRDADTAMYAAKASSRGTSKVFDATLRRAAVERGELEHDLRHAVERGEITTLFQPIVTVADGSISGAEALVRWSHPRLGLLSPDRFLGIAEDTGLIVPIGDEVLRQACHQAAEWRRRWGRPLTMSVNVSAAELGSPDYARRVEQILAESGLPVGELRLELTEQVVMADTPTVRSNHERLRRLGVRFYVDDFGTGYSSLTYLQRFDPDGLKIDRSFMAGIPDDPGRTEITTAVLGMARSLRLTTVAEGVESEEQLEWLRAQGCESAQGYWFSRPVPADEFEARFGPIDMVSPAA